MIRADFIYVNGDYLYAVLSSGIVVYAKMTYKKLNILSVRNASKVIFDDIINKMIFITTKGEILIYKLSTYEFIKKYKLKSESDSYYYDSKQHILFITCMCFMDKATYFYSVNISEDSVISLKNNELLFGAPISTDETSISFACSVIDGEENKTIYLRKYKKDSLEFVNAQILTSNLSGLLHLSGSVFYNKEGIEDVGANRVLYFKKLGIEEPIILAKKVNDFYFLSDYLNAYILDSSYKLVCKFHVDNLNLSLSDIAIDDESIYLLKGKNVTKIAK